LSNKPTENPASLQLTAFSKFAWLVLLWNLLVVAWGVMVRASKSGDGCGSHWPLCDGTSLPQNGPTAKIIEMSHRGLAGIASLGVLVLLVWAFKAFPKGHLARKASVAVFAFTGVEALIGAAIVKLGWVTTNESVGRAIGMCAHVVSTFFLVGSIALVGLAGAGLRPIRWKGQSSVGWILGMASLGICMLAMSGAISALGHTLKPTDDVLKAAMNPTTHWMVRVQPLHPLIAISIGLYILLACSLVVHLRPDEMVKRSARWVAALYGVQLALGALNIWFKAPIPMQMAHLVLADANWISLVVLCAFALGTHIESVETRPAPRQEEESRPLVGKDVILAYIGLTKPRVISLLLFTTLTSAVAAKGEWPGTLLFLCVALGGYMAAGAANAINMVIDRDIDLSMKRTSKRPTVTQTISSRNALIFAFTLAASSFGILWLAANLLSAVLALSGLVFYVVVYTLLLKRRTWHNIVIGGAAGAFPPLVGWAAVTNSLPPLALYLFAIIFVWTPVHFWALALLLRDDYAAAGVPMLPVVKGERYTVVQIALYTAVTAIVTCLPLALPQVGWIYGVTAVALNCVLVYFCVRLFKTIDRPRASGLFHYSMLYLAILFLMFAVDRFVVRVYA
jgi:protoheme IX farnesyltransferase